MNEATMPTTSFGVLFFDIGHARPLAAFGYGRLEGAASRSIPQPRQTLNIGAALAQESAARPAFGQRRSSGHAT